VDMVKVFQMFFELPLTEDMLHAAEDEIFAVHVSTNLHIA